MKTIKLMLASFIIMVNSICALAQTVKPTLTVLNIDTKGVQLDPSQMGNLVRIELDKLNLYDVTDRYDVTYLVQKNNLNISNCYGKLCLMEIGNVIKCDYMYTGSAELYGETIIITFRLVNIKTGSVEKTTVMEFLNLPLEVQSMVAITIRKMFEKPNDELLLAKLTKPFNYENAINNPNKTAINLSGPRFGYSLVFGETAERMKAPFEQGGYEAYPASFLFGYQFEKQYLNEGNYQALFEFIPMIGGLDQQMIIPSLTLLNGFRNTKSGWEIAIGPTFNLATYSQMGKVDGVYYTKNELSKMEMNHIPTHKTLDINGEIGVGTALVLGLGKTFKSGKMNIPVNVFGTIPTKDGWRIGISIGYNAKNVEQ